MEKKLFKKNKLDKWFLLSVKKILLIFVMFFVAVILHNLIYGLFQSYFDSTGGDEPFFFIVAVIVIPLYFIICIVYSIIKMIKDKTFFEKKFIFSFLLSILFGMGASFVIIEVSGINESAFVFLSFIFVIIFYYLIRYTTKK